MDTGVIATPALLAAAREGLRAAPKTMEPKWLYDAEGSALFERITDLPEYYPTRTETAILRRDIDTIAGYVPQGAELIELGAGASVKTRLLLDRLDLGAYRPQDISSEFLAETARGLSADYPDLAIEPITGDFTTRLKLPETNRARVAFFPGSTLGNLPSDVAQTLLAQVRNWPGIESFVLGVDLVKDVETLVAAYDDAQGVTAAFNLNLLRRMNREIGTDFDLDRFAHVARWNESEMRMEMHLQSRGAQDVALDGAPVHFDDGETIHTESSRKFTFTRLARLAASADWRVAEFLTDPDDLFAVAILTPQHGVAPA